MFTEITSTTESTMLKKFEYILDHEFSFLKNGELFLAISGGKDSMTLSHLLLQCKIEHTLLHCNFNLRGKESDEDEKFLKNYADKNNLLIHVKHFDTYNIAQEEKLSIQECARKLRYDWFNSFLQKNNNAFLLTAHHLDDSIETFFINLMRGTGYRGLSGIPIIVQQIVRPLSKFTAEEIYRYIDAYQVDYRADSSNAKKDYLRNRVRIDLIPVLSEIEPEFRNRFLNLFEELNELKNNIDKQVELFRADYEKNERSRTYYLLEKIKEIQPFFREQLLRNFGIYKKNSVEFTKFLNSKTGNSFFTENFEFLLDRDQLIIENRNNKEQLNPFILKEITEKIDIIEFNLSIKRNKNFTLNKTNSFIQQIDFNKVNFPITIRKWKSGDTIKPLGLGGTKLVSDILIDRKIDRLTKINQFVIEDAKGEIITLIGIAIADAFKITENTSEIIEITSGKQ